MARSFLAASSYGNLGVATGLELTGSMSCFVKVNHDGSAVTRYVVGAYYVASPYLGWALALNPGNKMQVWTDSTGWHNGSSGVPSAVWSSVGFTSDGSLGTLYVDGRVDGTWTDLPRGQNIGDTYIGARNNHGSADFFANMLLGSIGVWNISLSAAEASLISSGVSPLLIRPQNLVFYMPMRKGDSLTDWVGGITMTNYGTTESADHPPVWYPSSSIYS